MASNRNNNNNVRFNPNEQEASSSGIPRRMRPRNFNRMRTYNEQRVGERWSDIVDNDRRSNEAYERTRNVPNQQSSNNRKKRNPFKRKDDTEPSTSQSRPKDEVLYDGSNNGGKPLQRQNAVNMDYANFPLLIRTVYKSLQGIEGRLQRICPFPIFQHAMNEFLQARIMHYLMFELGTGMSSLERLQDPYTIIECKNRLIPKPIYEYICGIGTTISPNNDVVKINHPEVVIPQDPEGAVPSGHFGEPRITNQNSYMCYMCPWITRTFIEKSLENNRAREFNPYWSPFNAGFDGDLPEGYVINENLLGWWPVERYHVESQSKLADCRFSDNTEMSGKLCHSAEALDYTQAMLRELEGKFEMCLGDFEYKENLAIFPFKINYTSQSPISQRFSDILCDIESPFSFGASLSNKSNYFSYRRKRFDNTTIGPYFTVNGRYPANWKHHYNDNFNLIGEYIPLTHLILANRFQESVYREEASDGKLTVELTDWIGKHFLKSRFR